METFDVLVVGGGPSGSVCASRLAQKQVRVAVLEKERFPRFHLGESLLPVSMPVLDAIGVFEKAQRLFIPKYGARFHDDITGRKERFAFAGAWRGALAHAFEVPRDDFDKLLLDHARESGADVREEWKATRFVREGGRTVGVEAVDREGNTAHITAKHVVDATGRDALSARGSGTTDKIEGLDQTALFQQYDGVPRGEGDTAGDIDIVLFRESPSARANWFWMIPFADGRTSVGAVVSRAWIRERRARLPASGDDADALFEMAVAEAPTAREMLSRARPLWPKARATADFSYRVRALTSDGALSIGDAAGFIDPLFSTGAHLAMVGGLEAADAIVAARAEPDHEAAIFAAWAKRLRAASETFILAVQAFYAGGLVDYLFAENKHTALRRSITSLLAGDVFEDSVWLRDAKRRMAEMAAKLPRD